MFAPGREAAGSWGLGSTGNPGIGGAGHPAFWVVWAYGWVGVASRVIPALTLGQRPVLAGTSKGPCTERPMTCATASPALLWRW